MQKKVFKIIIISAVSIVLLLILGYFSVNLWLKNKLSDYIAENSDYIIDYDQLDVSLGTGNILATKVSIKNKELDNQRITEINGTIDTIHIGKIKLWNALWNREIMPSKIELSNPNLTIKLAPKQKEKVAKKKTTLGVEILQIRNGNISIFDIDNQKLTSIDKLNICITDILLNTEKKAEQLPFSFDEYQISGRNFYFRDKNNQYTANQIDMQNKILGIQDFKILPLLANNQQLSENASHLEIKTISLNINQLKDRSGKTDIKAENLSINGVRGKWILAENQPNKKKNKLSPIPIFIKKASINGGNFQFKKGNQTYQMAGISLNINDFEMNEETAKQKMPFKLGFYEAQLKGFQWNMNEFYNLNINALSLANKEINIRQFSLKPKVSRAEFVRRIPKEKDLYTLQIPLLQAQGNWDFSAENPTVDIDKVTINQLKANIFRSKIPADDMSTKLMYSDQLKKINFPLYIKLLNIKNSELIYEEDTPTSDGPGKLIFGNFNLNAQHINSAKKPKKPTEVGIDIACQFMNSSPMKIRWTMNTNQNAGKFAISGRLTDLPAHDINPFLEPYLKIKTTGSISNLVFNFTGDNSGIQGTMNMKHKNLKVEILKKDGDKNKFLSAVANLFVNTNSGKYPESVTVEKVERDPTKSFFNLFWKGIQEGLKESLVFRSSSKDKK